jgi:ferritin
MPVLSKRLEEELNRQISKEFEAAYSYFAAAVYCKSRSLNGFAHWFESQAAEEIQHGVKLTQFLLDLGKKIVPLPLAQPRFDFSSLQEVFELSLKNETDFADRYNELSGLALSDHDNITYNFLNWFLTEQVEEIALFTDVLCKIRMVGEEGSALFLLNDELARQRSSATAPLT